MPTQTVVCSVCPLTVDLDVPTGQQATLRHQLLPGGGSEHTLKMAPRVMPIHRPTRALLTDPKLPLQEDRQP